MSTSTSTSWTTQHALSSDHLPIITTINIRHDYILQRSRPTRSGTVRQQTTATNRDHLYPDSLLFVSAGFSASGQFAASELILNSTTKPLRRRPGRYPTPAPADGGRHTFVSRAYCQVSLPCMCPRRHQSRSSYWCTRCSGLVHAKCSGLLNAAQYRRNKDWTCTPARPQTPSNQHHHHPHQLLLHLPNKLDDSTFNVLQFNANGIGNKLTELGVVLKRNKVTVAVIQKSKFSSKSKNPCIRNYTTVRKERPHGHGGGLLVFIHESITCSKQPSSPEALSDPHLEVLTIKTDIGNTKLIISKIYIPPASSCSNGYQSSL